MSNPLPLCRGVVLFGNGTLVPLPMIAACCPRGAPPPPRARARRHEAIPRVLSTTDDVGIVTRGMVALQGQPAVDALFSGLHSVQRGIAGRPAQSPLQFPSDQSRCTAASRTEPSLRNLMGHDYIGSRSTESSGGIQGGGGMAGNVVLCGAQW